MENKQSTGYSGTAIVKKLGILESTKLLLINAPSDYFELLGSDFSGNVVKSGKTAEMVHLFVVTRNDLGNQFLKLIGELPSNAIIWVSWYKKSAKIPTDITEDVIRGIVLPTIWVDVKVCAVSEQWSGLKIVKRKELR